MFRNLFQLCGLFIVSLLAVPAALAQEAGGDGEQAFNAAAKAFNDGMYERADRELDEFVKKFPGSPKVPQSLLFQAQARYQLRQYEGAVAVLTNGLPRAGDLADQYLFWLGESEFSRTQYKTAADYYARLSNEFTNSPLRLQASYGEAFAWFRQGDAGMTVQLLTNAVGTFRQAALTNTNEALHVQAGMLLSEAYVSQKNYREAETTLNDLGARNLTPDLEWKRQFALAQIELAEQKSDAALNRGTNLLNLAAAAKSPQLLAQTHFFRADILKKTDPDAAVQSYEQIIQDKEMSSGRKREAMLRAIDLYVAQSKLTNAIQRLDSFIVQNSQDPSMDLLRITLGELYLKQFYALAKAPGGTTPQTLVTNYLRPAQTNLALVINTYTNSSLLGRAYLNRGWCLWEESVLPGGTGKIPEALAAFQNASEKLRVIDDQAMARFKVADCYFLQKNYTNALQNYGAILTDYDKSALVKDRLFAEVLYQMVRSSVELRDWAGAKEAVERLVADFPRSAFSDRSAYYLAQALLEAGKPQESRATVDEFRKKFPDSRIAPDAELLLGKTYAEEGNWTAAAERYGAWVSTYTNHPALAQAEFDRAWIHYRSDQPALATNALTLFSNYVARARGPLVPLAQLWIADYFFNQGNYEGAEYNFQLLATNVQNAELAFQARVWAAQSALLRAKPRDARDYLTPLVNDPNCPPSVLPQVYFVLGDVELAEPRPKNEALINFTNAIVAFRRILTIAPGHALESLARGKIADCYRQIGDYDSAEKEYRTALASASAGIATRNQAEYGLGLIQEKRAEQKTGTEQSQLLRQALDRYQNILYGKGLKAGEQADQFWIKEAGLAAGRLAERLDRSQALRIYQRLLEECPALRTTWEKKLAALRSDSQ